MITVNNKEQFTFFSFPGGERHCKLADDHTLVEGSCVSVRAILKNPSDIMDLLLLVDAVRRESCFIDLLKIHYFPYAQQDRINDLGESLSSKVMAELINSLDVPRVEVFDPHSDVVPALLNNCRVIDNTSFVCDAAHQFKPDFLIVPDNGAKRRVEACARVLRLPLAYCDKRRDARTGALTGFKLVSDVPEGSRGMIVDDICVGGGTFLGMADLFDVDLALAVSHGVFSNGTSILLEKFKSVYTTDSFYNKQEEGVGVYKIR